MLTTLRCRLVIISISVCFSIAMESSVALAIPVTYNTGSDRVSGTLFTPQYTHEGQTYGPFGSDFSYRRIFDGDTITKRVRIQFVFDEELGFNRREQRAFRTTAFTNIEGIWNSQFLIVDTANGSTFPLAVDVRAGGRRFDQSVAVHPGTGRANVVNWFVTDSPSVMAHEFGHLLGLYDEYIGGSVDKYPNPTLSNTGLMGLGALRETPEMFPRYYQQYLDFMSILNPSNTFTLAAVPEPSSFIFIVTGIFILIAFARMGQLCLHEKARIVKKRSGIFVPKQGSSPTETNV